VPRSSTGSTSSTPVYSGVVRASATPAATARSTSSRCGRDVEARYAIDPDRRTLHGISLGAIGTWHMAPLYPESAEEFEDYWRPAAFEPGWEAANLEITETELDVPAVANGFELTAANLSALTLDTRRMRLDAAKPVTATLTGDGATTLRLLGDFRPATTATLDGAAVPVTVDRDGLTVAVELPGTETRSLVLTPRP
jgi:hypothetical protein